MTHNIFKKKILHVVLCIGLSLFLFSCAKQTKDPEPETTFEIEKEVKRGPLTLMLKVDKKEISIAERIRLVIEVRAEEEYTVQMPEFGEKLQQFGIAQYSSPLPQLVEDNKTLYRRSYELEPFLSGKYTIPPLTVTFWKKGEEDTPHEIENEEISITVTSLLPEDTSDLGIYEIAAPVELPGIDKRWIYSLLGILILVGTSAGIFIWRKRKEKKEVIVVRPAYEIAYDELEGLLAADLIEKGEVKTFYLRLSDILRTYIENRFELKAPEQTTEEFLDDLRNTNKLVPDHKELLTNFLHHCDMVKFAEHEPDNTEIQQTFDACKRFISETEEG